MAVARPIRLSPLLLAAALGSSAPWARAEGPDSSVAEALFQEGRRLSAEQRYAEACPKFAESQRLEPAIGTLLNLATCHAAEGKTASAWSEFTRALGEAQRDNRADVLELARARIAELEPRLSKLVIEVAEDNDVPGLEVRLDGQVLQKPAWGIAAPIDPGTHTLRATAPGHAPWQTEVVLGDSEQRTHAIPRLVPLKPEPAPAVATPPPAAPLPPAPSPPWPRQKSWALAVGGVGVAGIATSVILGFSAKSTFDGSDPHCDSSGCDDVGLAMRHDAVMRGRVATIVFGVGAAALVGGGVLWLTAPRPSEANALNVGVSPQAVVARYTWH